MRVSFEELGIPVRSVNWVRTHAGIGPDGEDRVWATMGQQAEGFFIVDVDVSTGNSVQVPCPDATANYPTATCLSSDGSLYVGAAHNGHLYVYRGEALVDLGTIHPEKAIFPCRIDEDGDGGIWVGSYGTADLTRFDPRTKTFTRFGAMDDVDMYCYPLVDHHTGAIACLIRMTQQHVVLFDPQSGERTSVGPTLTKEEGAIDLVRATDGRLYITTDTQNFLIDGLEAVPTDDPIEMPIPRLQSGATFEFADAHTFLYRTLAVTTEAGDTRTIDVDYEAAGSRIFMLHAGPDRRVYGSSILPLHFFAHDSETGETVDYGKASESGGEAYSMANLDGQIYISSYPAARISAYDPEKPYRYGADPDANPRELGRIDEVSYRPRSTLAGPMGRIWTASLPDYGLWGGPLAWLDPKTGDRGSYRHVAGEGSCYTLAHLESEGLIAVGTTVNAGTGTQPRALEAQLVLWDYEREQVVWEGAPASGLAAINALQVWSGALYGTAVGEDVCSLFRFNHDTRTFDCLSSDLPGRFLDSGLIPTAERLYGLTTSSFYWIDTGGATTLCTEEGLFDVPGPILDNHLYFATNHRLRRLAVPF